MKRLIFIFFIVFTLITNGQNSGDYMVLKPKSASESPDTIWGKIDSPGSGYRIKISIKTSNGIEKIKVKDAIEFVSDSVFFGCFPYKKTYVHAPRLMKGKMDLYFYYSSSGEYNYIHSYGNLSAGLVGNFIGNILQDAAAKMTSYFYVKDNKRDKLIMVPHSQNNFIEEVAPLFIENENIYNKIISGEYKSKDIPEIIEIYNK